MANVTTAQVIREVVHVYDGTLHADATTDCTSLCAKAEKEAEEFAASLGVDNTDALIDELARQLALHKCADYFGDKEQAKTYAANVVFYKQMAIDRAVYDTTDAKYTAFAAEATAEVVEIALKHGRDATDAEFTALKEALILAKMRNYYKPQEAPLAYQVVDAMRKMLVTDISARMP